jgi:plasmid maintenance system killer protein
VDIDFPVKRILSRLESMEQRNAALQSPKFQFRDRRELAILSSSNNSVILQTRGKRYRIETADKSTKAAILLPVNQEWALCLIANANNDT